LLPWTDEKVINKYKMSFVALGREFVTGEIEKDGHLVFLKFESRSVCWRELINEFCTTSMATISKTALEN
jgi:hypothetical protein